ncbi:MAG: winged helix-turn-helix transcriptional regulator [Candidatus Woesearchaeota archaeon]|nr:MAG: winged helix-turn-helix transcriptional regulator [Candidatus Woesearchaeota archaeon]
MDEEEVKTSKRDANNFIRDLKIITAISLGKNRNKDLARFLDTDKSHASKKIRELEEKGLVTRVKERRSVTYRVNHSAVTRLLQSRVVIVRGGKKNGREKEGTESGD